MSVTDSRPVYLNLLKIRQPVTAVLSIFHRLSGILMVLLLPGLVYLLNLSLSNPAGFAQVAGLLGSVPAKVAAVLICWAFAHHLLAGLRFLILDFDVGVERKVARQTAWLIHVAAALVALFSLWVMF
jgi:succinate dehydrogenase / fumarate reductase cytochrome b subunit